MVNDDNLIMVPKYTNEILNDTEAASYIDGIGIHWYLSDASGREGLIAHHKSHPDKFILSTEACNGYEPLNGGPKLGSWERGDRYARDIIGVLQRFSVGWTDWNLALDLQGGPNWAKNFVDSPIIVNSTADEFYKNPMFYVLAHFSKFIPPGSVRISSVISNLPKLSRLDAVAFVTPDNQRILVVLNSALSTTHNISIKEPKQHGSFDYSLPPLSIATFVWNK
jgi:glucosylceramidase